MKNIESILEAIGNTPLLRLRNVPSQIQASVWMKLEFLNPSGSLKDRIALRMIEDAEKQGANAIISMRITTSMVMQNAAEVVAYGTGVVSE